MIVDKASTIDLLRNLSQGARGVYSGANPRDSRAREKILVENEL